MKRADQIATSVGGTLFFYDERINDIELLSTSQS